MADEPTSTNLTNAPPDRPRDASGYWWANLRLIGVLLAIWATVSFGTLLLAEPLNELRIGNLPLAFWIVQQGAIYVFVVLIFVYAFAMDAIDRAHGVEEGQGPRDKGQGTEGGDAE